MTIYAVYEFSVDYLEENFQNYPFYASYQDYMLQTIETYSCQLKQKQLTIRVTHNIKEEARGPGLRKSKNRESS